MKLSVLPVLSGLSLVLAASFDANVFQRAYPNTTCTLLAQEFPGEIEFPGSANYTTDTTGIYAFHAGFHMLIGTSILVTTQRLVS